MASVTLRRTTLLAFTFVLFGAVLLLISARTQDTIQITSLTNFQTTNNDGGSFAQQIKRSIIGDSNDPLQQQQQQQQNDNNNNNNNNDQQQQQPPKMTNVFDSNSDASYSSFSSFVSSLAKGEVATVDQNTPSSLLNSIRSAVAGFLSSPATSSPDKKNYHAGDVIRDVYHATQVPRADICETVHISIVCAGSRSTRMVVPLLKSILFYRSVPLHIHFIVDDASKEPLRTLFDTWDLSMVNVSLYDIAPHEHKVASIPTVHYSGKYGLIKLVLPTILPPSVTHVLSLDTDLLFTRDIAYLWGYFTQFTGETLIGLVENHSEWYLGQEKATNSRLSRLLPKFPWPALSHGFNTGVMLLRLDRMRERSWDETWLSVGLAELALRPPGKQSTQLADQDIINAVAVRQPSIIYRVPCSWNLQLSDNSLAAPCLISALNGKDSVEDWQVKTFAPEGLASDPSAVIRKLKSAPNAVGIVHFNSPRKMAVQNPYTEHYRQIHQTFAQMDGGLLKRHLISCYPDLLKNSQVLSSELSPTSADEAQDECFEYRAAATAKLRTHLYYFEYSPEPVTTEGQDVTWVAQMSWDRLGMLEQIAERWSGPISITMYLSDFDVDDLVSLFENSDILRNRKNIALHLVYKQGELFPVNYLRNVALNHATTPYVILADIDFIPSNNINSYLSFMAKRLDISNKQKPKALVVTAFETFHYKFDFPPSKAKLIDMLDDGSIFSFRVNEWPKGHAPTDYNRFRTATEPYTVNWADDFEPYIVVSKDVARYDERFLGFGWNKVSHIYELMKTHYEFVVLPDAFLVHLPHSPSTDIRKYRKNSVYRRCLARLKEEFQRKFN